MHGRSELKSGTFSAQINFAKISKIIDLIFFTTYVNNTLIKPHSHDLQQYQSEVHLIRLTIVAEKYRVFTYSSCTVNIKLS